MPEGDEEPDKGDDSPDSQEVSHDDDDGDDLASRISELEKDRDKWKALSRNHEKRARDNAGAASKVQSVDKQLEELRQQLAERDTADVERAGRLAMEKVRSGLSTQSIKLEDVAGVLDLVDPTATLLTEGEPNDAAIAKLVTSLAKVAGRVQPDPDQGRRGGPAPVDMNAMIRRARGIPI